MTTREHREVPRGAAVDGGHAQNNRSGVSGDRRLDVDGYGPPLTDVSGAAARRGISGVEDTSRCARHKTEPIRRHVRVADNIVHAALRDGRGPAPIGTTQRGLDEAGQCVRACRSEVDPVAREPRLLSRGVAVPVEDLQLGTTGGDGGQFEVALGIRCLLYTSDAADE